MIFFNFEISKMNRLFSMTRRFMPKLLKTAYLGLFLYTVTPQQFSPLNRRIECFTFKNDDEVDPINNLLTQVFKIGIQGDTIGYAFCITENILVTASSALMEKNHEKINFEFYLHDQNINAEFQIVGHFENLTFIKINKSNIAIDPMPAIKSGERIPITPVQVVQKRSFLSINDGYIVTKSGGFGIVDGKGEIGSLVIANGRAAGVVTQIGRDSEKGFMRMVAWGDLPNLLNRIRKQQLYLGISAAAIEERDGLAVARVSPNSPFEGKLQMGDIIIRANNQTIKVVEDIKRIIMFSSKVVTIKVEREGKIFDMTVEI